MAGMNFVRKGKKFGRKEINIETNQNNIETKEEV